MNELEKNMKRIGTKNISEQSNFNSDPARGSSSQKQLRLLEELVNINRQMLAELQKLQN